MEKRFSFWDEFDTENNEINRKKLNKNSLDVVNWKCKEGHSWKDSPFNRSRTKQGCPYCAGAPIIEKNVAVMFPDILTNWDYEKNNSINVYPQYITDHYQIHKVFWKCPKGHEYRRLIKKQVGSNHKCKYCDGTQRSSSADSQKIMDNRIKTLLKRDKEIMERIFKPEKPVKEEEKFTVLYPMFAKQWDAEKNGMTAEEVGKITETQKYWFTCENGHSRMHTIEDLKNSFGNGCPYCNGRKGKYSVTLFP